MPSLLMRLKGPMQSWGTRSRFDTRDTEKEPSKSGVLGLVCAAMGIDRSDWDNLEPLTKLRFGVRIDHPGVIKRDFHTAMDVIRADTKSKQDVAVTNRYFLSDASFLVGFEGKESDLDILNKVHQSLRNPVWPLYLGRKSFVPSVPVYLKDGLSPQSLKAALTDYKYEIEERRFYEYRSIGLLDQEVDPESSKKPLKASILLMLESEKPEGSLFMDQPVSSFLERKFSSRYVISEVIEKEVTYVSE